MQLCFNLNMYKMKNNKECFFISKLEQVGNECHVVLSHTHIYTLIIEKAFAYYENSD